MESLSGVGRWAVGGHVSCLECSTLDDLTPTSEVAAARFFEWGL